MLYRSLFFTSFLLGSFIVGYAQKEANFWYFGNNAGLDFSGVSPVALTNGQLSTDEGCSTISDASGNLLFYTDGVKVWDNTHTQMPNGFGLKGDFSSTQSALIIQKPGSASIYYIFTADDLIGSDGICYSEVDMLLNTGMGDVVVKNVSLQSPSTEKLTAVKHCNNRDVWIVTHDRNSNAFRCFLVSSSGVSLTPVVSNAGLSSTIWVGQLKASPDGSRLANAEPGATPIFELFDFDRSNGTVSNPIFLSVAFSGTSYGVEFSPDGTKLYGTLIYTGKIYQFDLCAGSATAIANTAQLIGTVPALKASALQLGPDNKIYVARENGNSLGVINNPDVLAPGCNYVDNGVSLAGKIVWNGLPGFAHYYFKPKPLFTSTVNCMNVNFSRSAIGCPGASVSALWNFGDPASGALNVSTLDDPTHAFSSAGTYSVTLILAYGCNSDTISRQITAQSLPLSVTLTSTSVTCNGSSNGTASINAMDGTAPYTYQWSNGYSTFQISGLTSQSYTVTVTDVNGCNAKTSIIIDQPSVITLSLIPTDGTCDQNNGSAYASVAGSIGNYIYLWSNGATQFAVSNLRSAVYSVTITDGNGCVAIASVTIASTSKPVITISGNISVCLGSTATVIASGGIFYIWNTGETTSIIDPQPSATTIYTVTVTDNNNCISDSSVTIIVNALPTANAGLDDTICEGENGMINATGGNNYLWSNGYTGSSITVYPLITTTYIVTAFNSNCSDDDTVRITVMPIPVGDAGNNINILTGGSAILSAYTSVSGGIYQWNPSAGLNCTSCANPIAGPENTTIYYLIVTDVNGCTSVDSVTVTVDSICQNIYIPTAFSPNDDGENDLFKIEGGCIKEMSLMIFDRWGEKVFSAEGGPASGWEALTWDGFYHGKIMDTAVFTYHLTITLVTLETIAKKGNINLIR